MERHGIAPREGWQSIVESQGLIWHTDEGFAYWDESAYYSFSLAEIEKIEAATEEVYGLFIEAGDRIIKNNELMELLGIPSFCHEAIRESWRSEPPSLNYGRFDFGYSGAGEPKLFEFNCDTPTSMLEAGVIQWEWKDDVFPDLDQFTSLHEKLIGRWAEIRSRLFGQRIWFTHSFDPSHEDTITATYMRDLAAQAGIETHAVLIDDIGIDAHGNFVDREDQVMTAVFKLYPWEWLVNEAYGPEIIRQLPSMAWIEPIWKMIWSNKAILQILWNMFPEHPNLLAASVRPERMGGSYVAKPFLAREGSNIEVVERGEIVARSDGAYRDGLTMYQELYRLKDFGGGYPVIGSWIVDGYAAGMGVREDGLITGNKARFLPHVIRG